jgi:hypothetical protein
VDRNQDNEKYNTIHSNWLYLKRKIDSIIVYYYQTSRQARHQIQQSLYCGAHLEGSWVLLVLFQQK